MIKRVLILAAMEIERELLMQALEKRESESVTPWLEVSHGLLDSTHVTIVQMGIGKVNAAVATALLLQRNQYDLVINTGVAGGLLEELSVGDVVMSDALAYHDVDARLFGYALGQVPSMDAVFTSHRPDLLEHFFRITPSFPWKIEYGLILSGDQFIAQEAQVSALLHHFPQAKAVEMEGAAVAHVAHLYHVPFIVIRAISDKANSLATMSYEEFLTLASSRSAHLVRELLNVTREKKG